MGRLGTASGLVDVARVSLLGAVVGVVCGAASAAFLLLLELATATREATSPLVFALPLAGLGLGWLYERYGGAARGGNDLVIDRLYAGGPELPLRMAPMVLLGTVATHLFGGSAGREGTAVQMGASLTDFLTHRLHLSTQARSALLVAGASAGFGSVFGTPLAGAVFGLEFVVLGRLDYRALLPALIASVVGDLTTRSLGVTHTAYQSVEPLALSPLVLAKWLVFAVMVAAVAYAFIELTSLVKRWSERRVPRLPLRMALGGLAVVALWQLVGTSNYLGLSLPLLTQSATDVAVPWYAFALKLVFTALTVGTGYLGGEVTPLFVIGGCLGNVLAQLLELPLALGAGVGLVAVFAAAANTPLALSLMAVELLGASVLPHAGLVCVCAYVLTGHRSIYRAQRLATTKLGRPLDHPTPLRELAD